MAKLLKEIFIKLKAENKASVDIDLIQNYT